MLRRRLGVSPIYIPYRSLLTTGTNRYFKPQYLDGIGTLQDAGVLRNNFIGRGIKTFLSSPAVDGNKGFLEAFENLPEKMKENIYRLDMELVRICPS